MLGLLLSRLTDSDVPWWDALPTVGSLLGQFLLGWTPNPGTAFYAGYNDNLSRNGIGAAGASGP